MIIIPMLELIGILLAFLVGFSIKMKAKAFDYLNDFLNVSVILILFLMGYDFGSHSQDIIAESIGLGKIVGTFTAILFIFNFSSVFVYEKLMGAKNAYTALPHQSINLKEYFYISGKYILGLVVGVVLGLIFKLPIVYLADIVNIILFGILFIIGYQIRQQGISLRQVFANRIGLIVSLMIVVSSLIAGMVSALFLHLQSNEGLILSSGFGWYSLSGILAGKLINHQIGAASFFIDFFRELIAIFLIPILGRRNPISLIAYSGATSMDFALPVIKVNLGDQVVPIAITSGMVLTILVPILIPLMWMI